MRTIHTLPALAFLLVAPAAARAQATLTSIGTPLTIDLSTTVPGVNNGLFTGDAVMGSLTPAPGQLDLNAWDYFYDGSEAQAAGSVSNFPGTLPPGTGYANGGSLATGVGATDANGQRCIGIQPTGGHFTSGSLTLRVVNGTGAAINRVAVSYVVHVFNDRDRDNSFRCLYSVSNTAGSYVGVPSSAVVSPLAADPAPVWESHPVSFVITGISVPDGGHLYLRWVGDDVGGSGMRDEFALTAISITGEVASGPSLTASATGLPPFTQTQGTPSATERFTVSGGGLGGEVNISVPQPFELSLDAGSGFVNSIDIDHVAGTLAETTVHVRLNSAVPGPASGVVTITSTGANTLTVNVSGTALPAGLPVLYINELLASNSTGITDENGEHDDWFEIFNPNPFSVDLAGWYCSDDPANPLRYRFDPAGTDAVVPANGWLLIWADNQDAQGNLHTNFALSADGESIILTAPDGVTVVDQIVFGAQPPDVSYGRANDGSLPWVTFTVPTPGASNNPTSGIGWRDARESLRAWPIPASTVLNLGRVVTAVILDIHGREVGNVSRASTLDIGHLTPGIHILRTEQGEVVRFVKE